MLLRYVIGLLFLFYSLSSIASPQSPTFDFLPNVKTSQLMAMNAEQVMLNQEKAIALVKETLNITHASPYRAIRIRFIYDDQNQIQALNVYLLSSHYKSFEIIRINLKNNFTVASVINSYQLSQADLLQMPSYASKKELTCPDQNVQFVIGNNFSGDASVQKEVEYVYQIAKSFGYNPVLLNINNPKDPQPTVEAYEAWMSCPQVKGFYNESHGSATGIMLADDHLTFAHINRDLVLKFSRDVLLFDSCSTFNNPLLASVTQALKGNAQRYMAGIVPLPFGPSEKTASCIWKEAMDSQVLNQRLISACANKNGLDPLAFRIKGNGAPRLRKASI